MKPRVLHLLSQRPFLAGSGVTLDALVRYAVKSGWDQHVVVGIPKNTPKPTVGNLVLDKISPLVFGNKKLPFNVPGMSDVMPYASTIFSKMTDSQVDVYINAWKNHLSKVISKFTPDVIHSHHIWLMSSIIKDVAPKVPILNQCHATGLRQMVFCPHLADRVKRGCACNERFQILFEEHSKKLSEALGVSNDRIHIIPSGYREDLFYSTNNKNRNPKAILYSGKFSEAKGLPWLLDAFEKLANKIPDLQLHIAGTGFGEEAEKIKQRMKVLSPQVILHGQLRQLRLAELMRQCSVFVLPSFYEGIPLVLVEALACGCRLVSTELPGVMKKLFHHFESVFELVPPPRLKGVDIPVVEDLPAFVENLINAIETSLNKPLLNSEDKNIASKLSQFTWKKIFQQVEKFWLELIS